MKWIWHEREEHSGRHEFHVRVGNWHFILVPSQEWSYIFYKRNKANWIDLHLIDIGYEYKVYAGTYHEAWFRLLGLSLWATLLRENEEPTPFMAEIMQRKADVENGLAETVNFDVLKDTIAFRNALDDHATVWPTTLYALTDEDLHIIFDFARMQRGEG